MEIVGSRGHLNQVIGECIFYDLSVVIIAKWCSIFMLAVSCLVKGEAVRYTYIDNYIFGGSLGL